MGSALGMRLGAAGPGGAAAGKGRKALRCSARRQISAVRQTGVRVAGWTRGRRPGWRGCGRPRHVAVSRWWRSGGK